MDVDAWFASLDSRVLDGWIAYDQLEPISSPWLHTATVCMVLWQAMQAIGAGQGVKLPDRKAEDFMPTREPEPADQSRERITPEKLEAVLRRRFGV